MTRRKYDAYYTPEWCVHRLLDELPLIGGEVLDPCAGGGAIQRACSTYGTQYPLRWTSMDIDPDCDVDIHGDFLTRDIPDKYDFILTNPPYNLAESFATKSVHIASQVIFLLRLNWLATTKRHDFLTTYGCPDVYVLPNRPSFTHDGRTDGTEYAWLHWHRATSPDKPGQIKVLDLTPRAVRCAR